jgi:Planctomycete cytochrome C
MLAKYRCTTGNERAVKLVLLAFAAVAVIGISSSTLVIEACGLEMQLAERAPPKQTSRPPISFAEDIFPIFKGRCVDCHQPGGQGYETSGLDLRTYEGLMKGTKFGAMVIPGDPDSSNLLWLLDWRASPQLRMPHGARKLSTCDRDEIRRWIREGAKNN